MITNSRDDERVADKFGGLFHCLPLKSVAKSIVVLARNKYQRNAKMHGRLSRSHGSAPTANFMPRRRACAGCSYADSSRFSFCPAVDVRTLGIVVYITHKLGLWNHSQVRSVLSTTSGAAGTSGLVSGKARRQLLEQLETI